MSHTFLAALLRRHLPALLLFGVTLALYVRTLAPTVATIFDDSLEIQLAFPTGAILHPTGYPLYSLLGWVVTRLLPDGMGYGLGDAALRANLLSALAASAAASLCFRVAQRLGSASIPAASASLALAVAPIWWSQATVAEVYTLQGFLTLVILYALLRWEEAGQGIGADKRLAWVGLAVGFGLAHHRLTLLLLPGAALFLLVCQPRLVRRPRAWLCPILFLSLPLLLYIWLPLRADVGSLDDSYARIGFWGWVLGGGYSTFLAGNPLGVERTLTDLLDILVAQVGLVGVLGMAAGVGVWRMQPRRLLLLAVIALVNLLFAAQYRVADIEVFLIPSLIVGVLFLAVGLTVLWDTARLYLQASLRRIGQSGARQWPRRLSRAVPSLLAILFLAWPIELAILRFADQDRRQPPARAWGVADYGRDMLDAMQPNATVVGLLGEMTLLRYFQRVHELRVDIETAAADAESDRLAALTRVAAGGHPTYTTRPLAGLAEAFSLSAEGPLVRVWPGSPAAPLPAHPVEVALTPAVTLAGWDVGLRQPASGVAARVQIWWLSEARIVDDFKVSVRLVNMEGVLLAQKDDLPVHNSYPPRLWRIGETVLDGYDLSLAAPLVRPATLQVILYRPQDGSEIARWEGRVE